MTANQMYTEADLARIRGEWEQEQQQRVLAQQFAEIKGQISAIPAQIESVARRVVVEVLAEQRVQAAERTWGRAPVAIQLLQLLLALILGVAGYIAGKGGIG